MSPLWLASGVLIAIWQQYLFFYLLWAKLIEEPPNTKSDVAALCSLTLLSFALHYVNLPLVACGLVMLLARVAYTTFRCRGVLLQRLLLPGVVTAIFVGSEYLQQLWLSSFQVGESLLQTPIHLMIAGFFLHMQTLLILAFSYNTPAKRTLSPKLQMVVRILGLGVAAFAALAINAVAVYLGDNFSSWLFATAFTALLILSLAWVFMVDHLSKLSSKVIYLLAKSNEEYTALQMEHQRLESEERYTEVLNSSYERLRGLRHDIKNQMIGLAGLLEEGDILGAKRHLASLQAEIDPSSLLSLTRIPQLDAIVSIKLQQAAAGGIRTDTMFVLPPKLPLAIVDLCAILGNILDNAIEAALQVPPKLRYLNLDVAPLQDMWSIRVENASTGRYLRREENFASTKQGEWHGVGLQRVKELTERNGGYLLVDAAEERFVIELFFPLDEVKEE